MKKIISIIVVVAFTVTALVFAGNAVFKTDKVKTTKDLCADKGCNGKGDCDTTKCKNSGSCKMQGNKSVCSKENCKSNCKDISKCSGSSSKCDSTMCKGNMGNCKKMNTCPKK
jgi:hypothetical protein